MVVRNKQEFEAELEKVKSQLQYFEELSNAMVERPGTPAWEQPFRANTPRTVSPTRVMTPSQTPPLTCFDSFGKDNTPFPVITAE